jgi:hypothetical protein
LDAGAGAAKAGAGRQAAVATAAEEARKERRVRLSDEIFTPPSYARRCVVVEGSSSRGCRRGVVVEGSG